MKIFIDAGHGGVWPQGDPGVVSAVNGNIESQLNFDYALTLRHILRNNGYDAVLTRSQNTHRVPFAERTGSATPRDLFISLHFDWDRGRKLIYYANNRHQSLRLAECVDRYFQSNRILISTRSPHGGLYIDRANCPSILIEVDTITNATNTREARIAFADIVLRGVQDYLSTTTQRPTTTTATTVVPVPAPLPVPPPRPQPIPPAPATVPITTTPIIVAPAPPAQQKIPFKRVFLVDINNRTKQLDIERASIVGDKLYIAPKGYVIED